MSSVILSNFRQTHFPYSVLERVIGQPTYRSLKKIFKQVKVNTISVPSNEGGGQLGHLGTAVDQNTYAFASDIPYKIPTIQAILSFRLTLLRQPNVSF